MLGQSRGSTAAINLLGEGGVQRAPWRPACSTSGTWRSAGCNFSTLAQRNVQKGTASRRWWQPMFGLLPEGWRQL